ncbi:hypothetical protein LTR08_004967 [Meristemomyces frigidus]|nr:hypothetical protein LTR08_004967 [Meristemomyces frigidus]
MSTLLRQIYGYRRGLWYVVSGSLWGLGAAGFINDNFLEISAIVGPSMTPTLSPDVEATGACDHLAWNKWDACSNVRRGDVVLFGIPSRPEDTAVKRVIAVEGETVILNPNRRPRKGYTKNGPDVHESRSWDAWEGRAKVPPGHVWVEGDNWRKSKDSNWSGPISRSLILGKAVCVVRPVKRFGLRPWEQYKSRTKVLRAQIDTRSDVEALDAMGP